MGARVALHTAVFGFRGTQRSYISSPWRNIDLFLVFIAFLSLFHPAGAGRANGDGDFGTSYSFRALRALRPLCFTQVKRVRVCLNSLVLAVPSFASLLFLILSFTAAWAALGVAIFGGVFYRCEAT